MRAIKFRAWMGAEIKRMYSWEELINKIGLSESVFIETYIWKPMQFTGRYDMNDKPIFEGDILDVYYEEDFSNEKRRCVVEWEAEGFWSAMFCEHGFSTAIFSDKINQEEIEIIGNIHENPELLEGK